MSFTCPHCDGYGSVKLPEDAALPPPEVLAALRDLADAAWLGTVDDVHAAQNALWDAIRSTGYGRGAGT